MSADSTRRFGDSNAAQQQVLSLFLRSEREIFRCVAALVPTVTDAEDSLWEKFDAYDPAQPFTPWACRFALDWGPNDANSWCANGEPLLFDGNNQPKPAFHAVIAEAKKPAGAK